MHITLVCNVYFELCLYEQEPEHLKNEIIYQSSRLFRTRETEYWVWTGAKALRKQVRLKMVMLSVHLSSAMLQGILHN